MPIYGFKRLLFSLYMTYRVLLLGCITDIDRVSDCVLIVIKPFLLAGEAFIFRVWSERLFVSNHFIQCYELLWVKSESILIRFQTFKEPGVHSLFR